MTAFWLFIIITGSLAAVSVVAAFLDDYGEVAIGLTGLTLVLGFIMWGSYIANHFAMEADHHSCDRWGRNVQLQTRWIRYNTWSSDCLVLYRGQWISSDQIHIVVGVQP